MKPCLFLDRDGVIIHNVPYTRDPAQVRLMPGIVELLRQARAKEFLIIVVTNQSGIGRGLLSEDDYQKITARMNQLLAEQSLSFDHIYYAPYFEGAKNPDYLKKPDWRKPAPGMILQACQDFAVDLKASVMIGDRASDLEAAERGGVARKVLFQGEDAAQEIKLIPPTIEYETCFDLSQLQL
jgi:D-glycero-D-manno-heptose 1,7-bisphosphate phosphatase